jgi:uncharacterized repeat protein (TIGR03803 family)
MKTRITLSFLLFFTLSSSLFTLCSAQYSILHNFNGAMGANPYGTLTYSDTVFYGATYNGGAHGYGCIFSYNDTNKIYADIHDFNDTTGAHPAFGYLVLSDSILFGMTQYGGAHNLGCIFCCTTSGALYLDLHDFSGSDGEYPSGSLTMSGGVLYGMTEEGGANSVGCIFSMNMNGTGYKDLHDFNGTNGSNPYGSLIISDSMLYGMTNSGGKYDYGCIFSIDTNGSWFNNLHNFNGINGSHPFGGLTLYGINLYGMTEDGGAYGLGCLFSLNDTNDAYTDLLDFNLINGSHPYGDLLLNGNVLYGMTYYGGGKLDSGCVFSFNTSDTGNNRYSDLNNFTGTDGKNPYGSLTLSGSALYGMTRLGDANENGVIFKLAVNLEASINEVTNNSGAIIVYPNPASSVLFLILPQTEKSNFELYNELGEEMKNEKILMKTAQIDISSEPDGVYFYRVVKEDGTLAGSGKVVIAR